MCNFVVNYCLIFIICVYFFFCMQKTAYEMRISDWRSDVCSSDLRAMVSAGESSGSLPLLMERLADLLERQAEMRGKVITAVAYPLILAVFAVLVVAALMMRSEEHTSEPSH